MSVRKRPRQDRAVQTVDALVEATGQVLSRVGRDGITTTGVATRAGVSVGSLYQYFPNKEALLASYCERRFQRDVEMMFHIVSRDDGTDPRALLRETAGAMVRACREEQELYRELADVIPLVDQTVEMQEALARSVEVAAAFLATRPAMIGDRDPLLAATLMIHGLRSALFAVARHAPEKLHEPQLEESLARAAAGYLGM